MPFDPPKLISHRGICSSADENSYRSFSEARKYNFDYLETDLRASSDGEVFLSHDRSLNRVAGVNKNIDELTADELSKVRLSRGGQLLRLEQFLNEFSKYKFVFDVKKETANDVMDCLSKMPLDLSRIIFLFWEAEHQLHWLNRFPNSTCFARKKECWRAAIGSMLNAPNFSGIKSKKIYSLPPSLLKKPFYRPEVVNFYHNQNASLLAFLPTLPEEVAAAMESGFDFILSDHPIKR